MREDPRHVLDSPETMAEQDPSDMLGLVEKAAVQWKEAVERTTAFTPPEEWRSVRRVIVAGMGGSAIAGDIAATYFSRHWPVAIQVIRDYSIPAWVDDYDLFVACSYSGNTEETLSTWRDAGKKGLKRAVVTTGGALGEEAESSGVPALQLPSGYPPRAALPSGLVTLFRLLSGVGAEGDRSPGGDETLLDMEAAGEILERMNKEYGRDVDVIENPAKHLALWLSTAWPVIYAPEYPLGPVAIRWRGQLAENAKRVASSHYLSEMNHNEIVGWEAQQELYPVTRVLFLEDADQCKRISHRISTTAELIVKTGAPVRRFYTTGEGLLSRMMSLIALGDYTSVYLASAWGIDPTPVAKIDYLKSKLAEVEE